MPGYSSVPVIAYAYLKGFTGFDAEETLRTALDILKDHIFT